MDDESIVGDEAHIRSGKPDGPRYDQYFPEEKIDNEKIVKLGKKISKAKQLINMLYSNPIVSSNDVVGFLNITPATANSLIQDFIRLAILVEITGGRRYRLFSFEEYLKLFTKTNS